MPNPMKALKGLGGLVNAATGPTPRQAIRELLNIIKQGAKKDPAKVFLAEKQTGPRIGRTPEIKPPSGFSFGGTDPRITRAPALVEKAKREEKVYSQFKPVGKAVHAERATSVDELKNVTGSAAPKPTRTSLSGKWGHQLQRVQRAQAKLSDDAVREIRKSADDPKELARQHGISATTIRDIQSGGSYRWVK